MILYSLRRDRKICQVCKNSFSNASALSGHMVSHTKRIYVPNAGSASGSTNKVGANFKPLDTVLVRSNQKQGPKRGEGAPERKGKRKMIVDEGDSTGSRGSLTAVEEAALCLVAMSMGQRPENSENWNAIDRLLATPNGKEEYYETDIDDDDYEADLVVREKKCKRKFECNVCGKVFGSYQSLGGHRSSHKCKRLKICDKKDQDRRYECDFCGKVFESFQALGGHKKGHYG